MRTRKLTQWLMEGLSGPDTEERFGLRRSGLFNLIARKHSSTTISIIHARINRRSPGSMLAARAAGRVG